MLQLLLPLVICALVAVCAQACSGQAGVQAHARQRHSQAASLQQDKQDEAHDRYAAGATDVHFALISSTKTWLMRMLVPL